MRFFGAPLLEVSIVTLPVFFVYGAGKAFSNLIHVDYPPSPLSIPPLRRTSPFCLVQTLFFEEFSAKFLPWGSSTVISGESPFFPPMGF